MIKLIVDSVHSNRDINGNVYWFSTITPTRDKSQSITVLIPDRSNTIFAAREAGLEWKEIYSTESSLPIRQWNERARLADYRYIDHIDLITLIGRML
jgi:hypothetical protein